MIRLIYKRGLVRAETLRIPAILAIGALSLLGCLLVYFVVETGLQQNAGDRAIKFVQLVVGDLRVVQTRVVEAEAAERAYLLTGDPAALAPYDAAATETDQLMHRLRESIASYPEDADALVYLDRVKDLVGQRFFELRRAIEAQRAGRPAEALALMRADDATGTTKRLGGVVAAILTNEQERLDGWFNQRARQQDVVMAIVTGGVLFALLMMVAACVLATYFARTNQSVRAALQSARDAAVSADRAKSQFLATASHDLRQPLHAMNLFISALRRRVTGDEAIKLVANMASAAESMQMMFNALLDVSKLNAGVVDPAVRQFPIEQVFTRLRSAFADAAGAKGLDLEIEPAGLVLHTDPVLLESILGNLISNAVRYTRQGEVTVLARAQGEFACIEVSDTGPGIPADQIERAFEEFQRLDVSSAGERGLGLGLAIVRRLARLLDLRIEVDSAVGIGTSFTIHVPLVDGASLAAPALANAEAAMPTIAGRRLLLVDDDPLVRAALAREIADWGARITVVGSADAALWALGSDPPDVAIVDRDLGEGASGIDLLALLEARFGHKIPAVIVTGATDAAALDELRRTGVSWLTKPLDASVLRARVAQLLETATREPVPTG